MEHAIKKMGGGFRAVMLLLLLITALRIFYLSLGQFNLFFDEAQYWFWSKTPSFGYYSKPPMVAWLITATTSLCGDGEFCVRLSSPIMHMVTAIAIYFAALELFHDKKIASYSALTYITLPAVSVSSALISTDPPLLMFWALCTWFFVKALHTNRLRWWVLAGIAAGLGMLSKYNMLVFFISSLLYLSVSREHKKYLLSPRFWSAAVIAGLIFLPNVLWNFQNGMVSFLHTGDNASANNEGFSLHPGSMFEFISAQFGVFGPILFASLIVIIIKSAMNFKRKATQKGINREEYRLLLLFTLPLLALITAVSFISRAHANWAAPIYVPATILVVAWLINSGRKNWLIASLALHIFIAVVFCNFQYLQKIPGVEFTGTKMDIMNGYIKDPFKRMRGWSDLGDGLNILRDAYPGAKILTDSRKIHAELLYYVRPFAFADIIKWNPTGKIGDHFDMTTHINDANTDEFLYVTTLENADEMNNYFTEVERVGNVAVQPYDDFSIDYYIYRVAGRKDAQGAVDIGKELTPP
jgi:hypothetical protein